MTDLRLLIDHERLQAFCRKWGIRELDVFGSVLRDDFGPESDIDFLATFESGTRYGLAELLDMEDELSALVGRRIDLVDRRQLEGRETNPYRKASILRYKQPLYVR